MSRDRCRVIDVDGQPVRVQGHLTTVDTWAFLEVVRAVRASLEAEDRAPQFRAFLTRAERWHLHHPERLSMDGHAYRRRTRRRTRSRRR